MPHRVNVVPEEQLSPDVKAELKQLWGNRAEGSDVEFERYMHLMTLPGAQNFRTSGEMMNGGNPFEWEEGQRLKRSKRSKRTKRLKRSRKSRTRKSRTRKSRTKRSRKNNRKRSRKNTRRR
jgi:hypothetical protein